MQMSSEVQGGGRRRGKARRRKQNMMQQSGQKRCSNRKKTKSKTNGDPRAYAISLSVSLPLMMWHALRKQQPQTTSATCHSLH